LQHVQEIIAKTPGDEKKTEANFLSNSCIYFVRVYRFTIYFISDQIIFCKITQITYHEFDLITSVVMQIAKKVDFLYLHL